MILKYFSNMCMSWKEGVNANTIGLKYYHVVNIIPATSEQHVLVAFIFD